MPNGLVNLLTLILRRLDDMDARLKVVEVTVGASDEEPETEEVAASRESWECPSLLVAGVHMGPNAQGRCSRCGGKYVAPPPAVKELVG